MPPDRPAIAPPMTSTPVRSERRSLPSESATMSLSRMARSVRPYGDSVIRRTKQVDPGAQDHGDRREGPLVALVAALSTPCSGSGISEIPASPLNSGT